MNSTITAVGVRGPPPRNPTGSSRSRWPGAARGFSRSISAAEQDRWSYPTGPRHRSRLSHPGAQRLGTDPPLRTDLRNASVRGAGSRSSVDCQSDRPLMQLVGLLRGGATAPILTWIESRHQTRRGTVRRSWPSRRQTSARTPAGGPGRSRPRRRQRCPILPPSVVRPSKPARDRASAAARSSCSQRASALPTRTATKGERKSQPARIIHSTGSPPSRLRW
jgi:hypothetical protein